MGKARRYIVLSIEDVVPGRYYSRHFIMRCLKRLPTRGRGSCCFKAFSEQVCGAAFSNLILILV